ncbi:PAS domain S-box protein [Calothrix sp. NIES-2098]|uniref:PAS domain S-box protein n=1 Tax=Calothrix sp. NIES-2098 TaxID=1954171 RepID=UPI000BBC519E
MTAEVKAIIPQEIEQVLTRMGGAFVMLDREWRYTYVNDKAAELVGINRENFLGRSIWELFPEIVNSQLQAELHRAITEQVTVDFEYFSPIAHRWWENHIYPSEKGVSIFIRDITQRKIIQQYQAAQYAITNILAEATTVVEVLPKVLQSLCEHLGWQAGIFWSVDPKINELRCINTWQSSSLKIEDSREFYQCINSLDSQCLANRVLVSDRVVWEQEDRKDSELQAAIGFPIRLGSEILGIIECWSQEILEPDAELLKAIASQIAQFIKCKRTESLLSHSEARYRSLAEASASIIWIAAPWGNVVEEIPTWQAFTGQTPAKYKGWGWFDAIHPEDRQSIAAIWKEAFSTRQVAVAEYRVRRHDGEYRHMSIRGVPILDETCEIQEWVGMCVDITERKQAEAEREQLLVQLATEQTRLVESNTLLDTLFNNAPIGIGIWDENLRYVRLNQALAEINGLPQAAHLGKTVAELLPEIDARVTAAFRHVVETGESIIAQEASGETPAVPGQLRYWSVNYYPIALPNNITWVGATCEEITARKQAEVALQESETRFRLLAKNSTDMISRHTVDGMMLYISPACRTILGYEPEEMVGRFNYEFVHPEDLAEIAENYPINADLPDIYTVTHRAIHKDGHYVWLEAKVRAIHDPQTREIIEIQASSRDITQRKQEEDRQRFLAEASGILASSLDYEITLTSLAQLIVPDLADWCIVDIVDENQSVRRVATAHADPAKQQLVEQLKNYPPDLRQTEGVAEVIRSGKSQITDFISDQKMPAVSQNDRHFQLLQQLKPQSSICVPLIVGGRVLGAITLVSCGDRHDNKQNLILTEELARRAATAVDNAQLYRQAQQSRQAAEDAAIRTARLYEAEQTAREAAETANRIKDEFLAVLSHELRSPLNPILGWSNILQTQKLDEKTSAYALKTIERNARLQSELIEDLLDISRILQGKLSLNIHPVDLASVITAAMETVRLSAEAKSISIHTMREPEVGQVLGDASRLQQIIWNLLSNAVKFTPAGGRIDIRLEQMGTQAQITVSDTGKGISADFLPYVFEYFRQENSTTTRKFGGLGLGLAIVRHLVELHGGTVQAQSPGEGQGATFIVRLPIMQQRSQPDNDNKESQTALDLNGVQILLVDDDTDTRDFLSFLLADYGANVTATASAREAIAALTQSQPDILLSDIGMPEVDGWMLINQVRMLSPEQGGQIPAIAITAYAGQINAQQALKAGFNKHLAKPVEPTELVEVIAQLLNKPNEIENGK